MRSKSAAIVCGTGIAWCGRPTMSANAFASGASSISLPGNAAVKVWRLRKPCSASRHASTLESTPLERKIPSGRSATVRIFTA